MCLESDNGRKVCSMDYAGFERTSQYVEIPLPGAGVGGECQSQGKCPVGKAIRIPLAEDRRVFTPVARSSYVWQDYYDHLAGSFGFEHPFIRGLAKMRLRVTMALTVMLAMALGRIHRLRLAGQPEHLRSLVRSRAPDYRPRAGHHETVPPPGSAAGRVCPELHAEPPPGPDCHPHHWATSTPISNRPRI